MTKSSIWEKWEGIWMILDNLKWFQVNVMCKIFKSVKCNQETKKKSLATLTLFSISTKTWATSIRLWWFPNHSEAKTQSYISYEASKSSSYIFMVKKCQKCISTTKVWNRVLINWGVFSHFLAYMVPNGMILNELEGQLKGL